MLVVISPAKKLNWSKQAIDMTRPAFDKEAASLARTARNLTLTELQKLMDISPELARLNRDRFKAFSSEPTAEVVRPAALAFDGDTYRGLEAMSLDPEELDWAQDHLRILSGLYGVLRPKDAMQAYRLEMGSRLKTRRGRSLYEYWGSEIAKKLNRDAQAIEADVLINCASQEYFSAVDPKALDLRVITPVFLDEKNGTAKTISFFAKRARGAMARFVVQNRIVEPEQIRHFDLGGYVYQPELSKPEAPTFLRAEGAAERAIAAS